METRDRDKTRHTRLSRPSQDRGMMNHVSRQSRDETRVLRLLHHWSYMHYTSSTSREVATSGDWRWLVVDCLV